MGTLFKKERLYLLCAFIGMSAFMGGCTTSIGSKGDSALRSYPVPIEFHIAEGAYNNTQ
jgi:hypothetical protein